MRRLIVFNHVSLDGYFVDAHSGMNFTQDDKKDPEWDAFVAGNASGGGIFVFGRITYEMMAGFWPTPAAIRSMPDVAATMNNNPKIVFSKTLKKADWHNTRLMKGDLLEEIRKLKAEEGIGMVIFGSGSIVSQLSQARLIDEYQIIVNPVVLGKGRTMFEGMKENLPLELTGSRSFTNGKVLLRYIPVT
jgi:dihydrofolate reductase